MSSFSIFEIVMCYFLSLLSKIGRFLAVVLLVGISVVTLPTEVNGGTRSLTQAPLTEWVSSVETVNSTEYEVASASKASTLSFGASISGSIALNQVDLARQTKLFLSIKKSLLQYHSVRFKNISVDFLT